MNKPPVVRRKIAGVIELVPLEGEALHYLAITPSSPALVQGIVLECIPDELVFVQIRGIEGVETGRNYGRVVLSSHYASLEALGAMLTDDDSLELEFNREIEGRAFLVVMFFHEGRGEP